MKKLINRVEDVLNEQLAGLAKAYPSLALHQDPVYVTRADAPVMGKVALLSGGGSGHEPMHCGYIGQGMLSGACPGEIFTSPTPDKMFECAMQIDGGEGVLLIIKNYTGDILNFETATELLHESGVKVTTMVVDDDVVDASNLNRQQYWPRHVGRPKVEALAELLLELNPAMQVETRRLRMDQHNIGTVLPSCPIWVEAFDGPDDKTLLVETALLGGYHIASASGMGGCGGAPMGRRNLGALVLVGDFTTDILMAPPLAPRVTEAAALLADAVLEMVLA